MPNNIPPFTLYGLQGCPSCAQAEAYLRTRNLPFMLVICNDDPIAQTGVDKVTEAFRKEKGLDKIFYPVLVSRVTKEWKVGFDKGEYDRLAEACYAIASTSAASVFGSGQPTVQEAPVPSETPAV